MGELTRGSGEDQAGPAARERFAQIAVTEDLRQGAGAANLAWRHYSERLRPTLQASGFASLGVLLSQSLAELERPIEVLSLGGGSGSREIALARSFGRNYTIRHLHPEGARFDRAVEVARTENLRLEFEPAEIGDLTLDRGRYDLVVVRGVFHRLLDPARCFDEIAAALAPGGLLQVEDMVGKNGKLLWDENEWLANALLARLPESLTKGARLAAPDGEAGLGGPRQEEILEPLRRRFAPLYEHRHGAFMRFVCAHPVLGAALGAPAAAAQNSLDFLIDSDDSAVRHELMQPLELWGVYRPVATAGVS
jgi:SAM-dependent methyltransferase